MGQDGFGLGTYMRSATTRTASRRAARRASTLYTTEGQEAPSVTKAWPAVATLPSHGNPTARDGSLNGIYTQRYNAAVAIAQGSETQVNTTAAGQQFSCLRPPQLFGAAAMS